VALTASDVLGHLRWSRTTVQGRGAAYGEAGAGTPVLFLHGWGLGHHAYKRPLKRLAKRGCRVLAPALPGFAGTSDLPSGQRTIEQYAAWVDDFLTAVGVERPAVVIGHSFGGGVAIGLAHDFGHRVGQLVLINSVGGAAWGDGTRHLADRPVWEWGVEFARDLLPVSHGIRVAATVREDLLPNLLRNPRALWDVGMLARSADLRGELAHLRQRGLPVLVVSGEKDGVIPVSAFEALCDALGIEGTVLPGSHSWLLADPDAFDEVLANVVVPAIEQEAAVSALRELLVETTVPKLVADRLVDTAPPLWLSSDGAGDLASDLVLCHPPLAPTEVRARVSTSRAGRWRLTVVAHDRPGLLADTAGVLATEGMSILSASVATWDDTGLALHAVSLPGIPPGPQVLERIGARLRAAASGLAPEVDFRPTGRASVRIVGDANGDPLVAVSAPDQPGLLWAVCRWFADHGASIQAAGISGDRTVHDVFVVRDCPDVAGLERRLSRREAPLVARVAGQVLVGPAVALSRCLTRRPEA
jgi:pimeloyl-ACP methyl ester carboxylesterase/predicted amino acid-binding ACT domain protein